MKTLYLVRHAKSSWNLEDLPDIDRPLNERGYRDAHLLSKQLSQQMDRPDLIISSPACRTVSTALIFSRALKYPVSGVLLNARLYETGLPDYRETVRKTDESRQSLMIFAHNFTISEFASSLLGAPFEEMPTCAVLALQFETDQWSKIHQTKGRQQFYLYPKKVNPM